MSTGSLRIAVDMDEVIVDTYQSQMNWLSSTYADAINIPEGAVLEDHLSSQQLSALEDMMHEGLVFRDMAPMENAVEVLAALSERHEVFICTAAMEYPNSLAHKYDWVLRYLPFFDPLKLVFCGYKKIVHADVLIDDTPRQFDGFLGQPLLFNAPSNRDVTGIDRVLNWREIEARFL